MIRRKTSHETPSRGKESHKTTQPSDILFVSMRAKKIANECTTTFSRSPFDTRMQNTRVSLSASTQVRGALVM
jgi:hypothetical protein